MLLFGHGFQRVFADEVMVPIDQTTVADFKYRVVVILDVVRLIAPSDETDIPASTHFHPSGAHLIRMHAGITGAAFPAVALASCSSAPTDIDARTELTI